SRLFLLRYSRAYLAHGLSRIEQIGPPTVARQPSSQFFIDYDGDLEVLPGDVERLVALADLQTELRQRHVGIGTKKLLEEGTFLVDRFGEQCLPPRAEFKTGLGGCTNRLRRRGRH